MKRSLVLLCCVALLSLHRSLAQDLGGDLTLHRLLIDGEGWQVVADHLGFADGPTTDAEGNLYFSDMKAPGIFRVANDGTQTLVLAEPASGLKFGPDGRLYACQESKKRIVAITLKSAGEAPVIEEIATDVQPNDLALSHRGHLYFTETGKKQVTFVDVKTKQLHAADVGITAPNGIALSPDQGTLAVSDYGGEYVWAFRIEVDGTLSAKAPYMTMRRPIDPKGEFERQQPPPFKKAAGGDGMTTDSIGRYYVTTALGLQVFDPTGRACGLLPKPQRDKPLTSCALAGTGLGYLYLTNGDRIYRRKVQATGILTFLPPG